MIYKSREEADKELYPDDDGLPMADNTLQYEWIVTIKGNLDALFRHDPNVFVGGNLLWYAVEGEPATRTAPDALVVFGRPKSDYRGSYMQWREDDIAPQVVFEILSPGNRDADMARKFEFYDRYGVEEYYLYDPDEVVLSGWRRVEGSLQAIEPMHGWRSPRLGIRFDMSDVELAIYGPDDERFLPFVEVKALQERAAQQAKLAQQQAEQAQQQAEQAQQQAEQERQRAEQAQQQAEQAQQQAEQERQRAEQAQQQAEQERQRAEQAQQQAEQTQLQTEQAKQQAEQASQQAEQVQRQAELDRQRAERLAAQLRALGIEPEA